MKASKFGAATSSLDTSLRPRSSGNEEYESVLLKAGAWCAAVGTAGYFVTFLLHGDLPDHTTESILEFIAGRPWAFHHLLIIFCLLLWLAALMALARSLVGSGAAVLGLFGQTSALLGMAVLLWHYNIDGPALETVADAWIASTGPERAVHLERGTLLVAATSGLFPLYVALLLGLPFILFGAAIVLSENYPAWLGWVAAAAGSLAFVTGTTNFSGSGLLPMNLFVLTVLVLDAWMIVLARHMWRMSRGERRTHGGEET